MAQVPYSPVPQVAPSSQALPSPSADVPAAAFGGDVAQAIGGLGKAMESSANELFGRAVALQNLNNETEASEAESTFMIEAGKLHADFNALQGKARVDAFPAHQQALEQLRGKIGDGLGNEMSRKLYTTRSRATLGRTLFNAAGAAATANKQWTTGVVQSSLDLAVKTIEDNPKDEGLFQQQLGKIKKAALDLSAQMGFGEGSPQEVEAVTKAISKAWSQRLVGLSRTSPFEAQKLLEANKTKMISDDFLKADTSVRTQVRAVGSANIANEVWAAGQETPGRPARTLEQMEVEAERKAKSIDPDDPILANTAVAAVRTKFNQAKHATTQERLTNEQIVLGALQSGARNEQELLADQKVAAAFEALPSSSALKKSPLNYQLNKYNTQRDIEVQDANWLRLRGLSISNPIDFLNTNLNAENLSNEKRDWLLNQRDKLIKQQGADPRVTQAMRMLRGTYGAQMEALKIFTRDKDSPADYDKFTGALAIALDDYVATNKKPADANTIIKEIGPNLMKSVTEEGRVWGLFGDRKTNFFKPGTHTSNYEKFEKDYQAKIPQATSEQIYRAYQRAMYQHFYGKKTSE